MNGSTFSQYRAGVSVTYSVDVRTVWCCNSPCDMSSGKKRTTKQLYFASRNTSKQKVLTVVCMVLLCFLRLRALDWCLLTMRNFCVVCFLMCFSLAGYIVSTVMAP